MYNKIIVVGNLTRDVELRYLPSGSAIATIGLASNRRYKRQDGTQADETCFVDCKLFGRTGEIANQYLRKGSKVLIEGRLTYESWTDQNGVKRSKHTIVAETMQMLDSRSDSSSQNNYENYQGYENPQPSYSAPTQGGYAPQQPMQQPQNYNNQYQSNIPEINIDDDEIPF